MQKGSVVITGVSSGIGWSICRELIGEGYRVFGSVRQLDDATRLKEEWGENFTPLVFDVTDPDAVVSAAKQVGEALGPEPLAALINNAGMSDLGPVALLPVDRYRRLFEVNVFGMISVTQAFLPLLGARPDFRGKPGRIINISSVFGVISYPLMSPYVGSKHAIDGITDCLRVELLMYGIAVILIAPGAVQSRIWEKNKSVDYAYALGTEYEKPMDRLGETQADAELHGMSGSYFARRVRRILERRWPRARYRICANAWFVWYFPRYSLTIAQDYFKAWMAGLLPGNRKTG